MTKVLNDGNRKNATTAFQPRNKDVQKTSEFYSLLEHQSNQQKHNAIITSANRPSNGERISDQKAEKFTANSTSTYKHNARTHGTEHKGIKRQSNTDVQNSSTTNNATAQTCTQSISRQKLEILL